MNEIISAAVHDLSRGPAGFSIKLGKTITPINDLTQRVVDSLYALYSSRTSKAHGEFASGDQPPPTQTHVSAYLDASDPDFDDLTAKLMETLKTAAQKRAAAGGGHVFFAHFRRDDRDYLLVTIVSDRVSAALSGTLELTEVTHLDLDHFRFAGRIDLTAWKDGTGRYIGFLKGVGEVSEYFREFLGCDAIVKQREDTERLVDALDEFATAAFDDRESRTEFLNRAKDICDRARRENKPLEFQALANELVPSDPAALLEVLTSPERTLTDGISPHGGALAPLVQFRIKTPYVNIVFAREALISGDVVFDADTETLVLRNLPDSLLSRLRDENVGTAPEEESHASLEV